MIQNNGYDPKFDEALLEHYDENMRHAEYKVVLERMRRNGYEPRGPGAPQQGSPFYNSSGRQNRVR